MAKLNLQNTTQEKLHKLLGDFYSFLGFKLNLATGTLTDTLTSNGDTNDWNIQVLNVLLTHYSAAHLIPIAGKLVKFKDFSGGCAYEDAFVKRAVDPIADVFGEKPEELLTAAKRFGGAQLRLGDASAEIPALRGIPLTYVLWGKGEFPASANILYDQTASNYLPTEDIAVLGELATARLIEAGALHRK